MASDGLNLRNLERCFLGAVPASIATSSPEGRPNVTYLSVVHFVDDDHLALSYQFFNKTRANILAHGRAQILLADPVTFEQFRIDVRYERTEEHGAVFERMRANLDAVASQTGMQDVFRLRGVDIYKVVGIERLVCDLELDPPEGEVDFLAALEVLSGRLAGCEDLDTLLDTSLQGLAELFDYPHAFILLADESGTRLFTVASHGFEPSGVGAEVAFGEGLIGAAAVERRPVRIANLAMEQTMAAAVRSAARDQGATIDPSREIPLPGLVGTLSQIAVPILGRGPVLGVLCVQSAVPGRLTPADEQAISTLSRQLATSMQLLAQAPDGRLRVSHDPAAGTRIKVRHYAADDSVFVNDDYLIKGLSGRLLIRMLSTFQEEGRVDFTNKELRVTERLAAASGRDNLDARLILLTRRLQDRPPGLRITKTGRGRLRLDVQGRLDLATGL